MTDEDKKNIISKIKSILENFLLIKEQTNWLQNNKESILKLILDEEITELQFYKLTSLLSTQSRSVLWEKYFRKKNNYKTVKKNENRGDLKKDNQYYEYKVSLNDQINFRLMQIRVWQECDYIIQFITFEKIYTFYLTKKEMIEEMELCGANSAHGTRESNKKNKNIEYTMTVKKDSQNWNRWIKKYLK